MCNPLSRDPEHALYPSPPGCTGHRLWQLLRIRQPGVTEQQYLRAFDRRNLVAGREWDTLTGEMNAVIMTSELWCSGRTVLLLGEKVRRAFGLEKLLVHPQERDGCTWRQLPHPSGRNAWYNAQDNRRVASLLLEELYVAAAREET
jgi:hypothetical protein